MVLKMVICHAHEEENEVGLQQLRAFLRPFQYRYNVEIWDDHKISAGTDWEQEMNRHLKEAQIILLLISPSFLAWDYSYGVELKQALERHEKGEARVIPIILYDSLWELTPLGKLQPLPTNGKAIKTWHDLDAALFDVARGIHKVIQELTPEANFEGTK